MLIFEKVKTYILKILKTNLGNNFNWKTYSSDTSRKAKYNFFTKLYFEIYLFSSKFQYFKFLLFQKSTFLGTFSKTFCERYLRFKGCRNDIMWHPITIFGTKISLLKQSIIGQGKALKQKFREHGFVTHMASDD